MGSYKIAVSKIFKHYVVIFILFLAVATTPLVLLLIIETNPVTGEHLISKQIVGKNCYYKKLTCADNQCDSAVLTCPNASVQTNNQPNEPFLPTGLFENADCQKLTGWSYNPNYPRQIITVTFFADGPSDSGKFLFSIPANLMLDDNDVTQIFGSHEFSYPIPIALKDGAEHQIYAYGSVGTTSGQLSLLLGSPKTVMCQQQNVQGQLMR